MQSPVLERLVGGGVLVGLLVLLALAIGPRNGPRAPNPDGLERPGVQDAFVPAEDGIAAAPEEPRSPSDSDGAPQWVPPGSVPHAPQPVRPFAASPETGERGNEARPGSALAEGRMPSLQGRGTASLSPRGGQDAPPPESGGEWGVQLGSFAERGNAERLSDWCRKQGLGVRIVTTTGEGGATYKVRVGPYASRDSARSAIAELTREGSQETRGAFVTGWDGGTP